MPNTSNALFDLLLFDFDGTLAHTLPAIVATIQKVFQHCGDPIPSSAAIEPTVGMPLASIMQRLNPAIDAKEAENRVGLYRTWYDATDAEKTALFPGVIETLQALRTREIPLVVSSNKAQAMLERSAERLGLTRLFDSIAGVLPEYPKKPDSGFFTSRVAAQAPQFATVAPERVLIVGDAWPDLAFAANLGAASCYASYGYGPEKECMPYGPDYTIRQFSELANLPFTN